MRIINNNINRKSGATPNKIKDVNKLLPRDTNGNPVPLSVGMVMACVKHQRAWKRPVKTVYLNKKLWQSFLDWVKHHTTEEEAEAMMNSITYDGVFVKPGSELMGKDIYCDFWETELKDVN